LFIFPFLFSSFSLFLFLVTSRTCWRVDSLTLPVPRVCALSWVLAELTLSRRTSSDFYICNEPSLSSFSRGAKPHAGTGYLLEAFFFCASAWIAVAPAILARGRSSYLLPDSKSLPSRCGHPLVLQRFPPALSDWPSKLLAGLPLFRSPSPRVQAPQLNDSLNFHLKTLASTRLWYLLRQHSPFGSRANCRFRSSAFTNSPRDELAIYLKVLSQILLWQSSSKPGLHFSLRGHSKKHWWVSLLLSHRESMEKPLQQLLNRTLFTSVPIKSLTLFAFQHHRS
jgi:hypothetical protein